MNKKMKSLILGATMIMALPIIGGCGSNTIGYVDSQKVVTQTAKSIEINKEINAKVKNFKPKSMLLMKHLKRKLRLMQNKILMLSQLQKIKS